MDTKDLEEHIFQKQRGVSMNKLVFVLMVIGLATALGGDEVDKKAATSEPGATPVMVSFTELKWAELPQRKGMQFAVLSGDPKSGEQRINRGTEWFVLRDGKIAEVRAYHHGNRANPQGDLLGFDHAGRGHTTL
jgi:hypothetical protein